MKAEEREKIGSSVEEKPTFGEEMSGGDRSSGGCSANSTGACPARGAYNLFLLLGATLLGLEAT